MRHPKTRFGTLLAYLLWVGSSHASPVAYTDSGNFFSDLAVAGFTAKTLNFDGLPPATTIASGSAAGGISFTYDFGGVQIMVSNIYDTTSAPNFLGTDDGDVFQDGDDFDISFGASHAIGMFFISADAMVDGDITLAAGGGSVALNVADAGADLGDGGIPYFLGIIDNANTFTSANVTTIGGGYFLYNVDDITTTSTSVPEPGTLLLLGAGLTGLTTLRKRCKQDMSSPKSRRSQS